MAATGESGVLGRYFENMQPTRSTVLTHDQTVHKMLWDIAEHLTGLP
jgi:hypothetical protein